MDGNEGTLPIGDLSAQLLSLRAGGTFATRAALLAMPAAKRKTGMVCFVLEDCSSWVFDENGNDGIAPDAGTGQWRPLRNQAMLYGRSFSFTAAQLADVDAFVKSIATVASPVTFDGDDLDGALVDEEGVGQPPKAGIAFWPSVTADSSVGAFTIDADIEFVGTYNGQVVTRLARLTSADGNETIIADGPLETLTAINVPAMADTDGALEFGFSGIGPVLLAGGLKHKQWLVKSYADASAADTAAVHVAYQDGTEDTVELAKGSQLEAAPVRIFADTTAPVTIYE